MSEKWALLKDGVLIKVHTTKLACIVEAIERKFVVNAAADFDPSEEGNYFIDGVAIVKVTN